jgi:RNA polymerase sigma-70 factor (ECF subfamily)
MMSERTDARETEPAEVAITRLLRTHGDRVYRIGLHMCATPEDAEDLVQETFRRAYRNWGQFKGRSAPSTWLYTIATRVAKRQHRRRSGEPRTVTSLYRRLPSGQEAVVEVVSLEESPLEQVVREEAEARLEAMVADLPLRFQLPLVLKEIADFSIAEIAAILGLKRNTVKTRIYRARMAMRKTLVEGPPRRTDLLMESSRRVCLYLLYAKQEARDRGVPFPLPHEELRARCHAVFATLDLSQEVFQRLHEGELPETLRASLKAALEAE